MPTGQQYYDEWIAEGAKHGAFTAIAKRHGVGESTVRCAVRRIEKKMDTDPRIAAGMTAMGIDAPVEGAWVKSHKQDEHGLTYSFYLNLRKEREAEEGGAAERIASIVSQIPAIRLPANTDVAGGLNRKAIIPINDFHAGALAWGKETGYGDWDLHIATERLKSWVAHLLRRTPVVDEVILFYNGDTLHANGKEPMTPASSHILDTDGRFFKAVDMTAAAMVVVGDLALQRHKHVRIVVKRGNHDEDSYIGLLMAMKYRYRDMPTVTVEEDPSPYWAHHWGKNFWFGHHGDRVKPQDLVMKMAADFPEAWGATRHRVVFTAHKHQREMKSFHGATWEQASCITEPDAYGSYWGNHAQLQAIVYDKERGEVERHTVKPD